MEAKTMREWFPKQRNLYTCEAVQGLIDKYHELGGGAVTVEEGTLGYGFMILYGEGLKTAIVHEVALNEWSSAHTIRMYNKMPKKYAEMLEDLGV